MKRTLAALLSLSLAWSAATPALAQSLRPAVPESVELLPLPLVPAGGLEVPGPLLGLAHPDILTLPVLAPLPAGLAPLSLQAAPGRKGSSLPSSSARSLPARAAEAGAPSARRIGPTPEAAASSRRAIAADVAAVKAAFASWDGPTIAAGPAAGPGLRAAPRRGLAALEPPPSPPAPPAPQAPRFDAGQRAAMRSILMGTGFYKLGMEALAIAAPLLALEAFKSITMVAVLVVVSGLAQAVASSAAGGLFERKRPQKVISAALAVQAAAIAVLFVLLCSPEIGAHLGLSLPSLFRPALVLPLYGLAAAAQGVVETGRRVLPRAVLGREEGDLEGLNAKTHMVYEAAGVAGAALAGAAIAAFGLKAALALHPLAYGISALVFKRIRLPVSAPGGARPPPSVPLADRVRAVVRGYAQAARLFWSDKLLRWTFLAVVIPQVIHRVVENIIFPVYAKRVLQDPSKMAWILGFSNFGECMGAVTLILIALAAAKRSGLLARWGRLGGWAGGRAVSTLDKPFAWVRPLALASLGFWAFVVRPPWGAILPFVALQSLTWAASDIKLNSYLQSRPEITPREIGFLYGSYLLVITILSFGIGVLLDAAGVSTGLLVLDIAITVAAAALYLTLPALTSRPKKK